MKTLEEIKSQLEELKPTLKEKFQVETLGVFGSYCHGEQGTRSDVDILVTFVEPNDVDLLDFIGLKRFLSRRLKIIGEVAKHLPTGTRRKHPQIPWSKIV